jgi:hypothetical protein
VKFEPDEKVEVLNPRTGKWYQGYIDRRRTMALIPTGKRVYEYEVSGRFANGEAWHGIIDEEHVRAPAEPKPPRTNWYCRQHPWPCEGNGPDCVHWLKPPPPL